MLKRGIESTGNQSEISQSGRYWEHQQNITVWKKNPRAIWNRTMKTIQGLTWQTLKPKHSNNVDKSELTLWQININPGSCRGWKTSFHKKKWWFSGFSGSMFIYQRVTLKAPFCSRPRCSETHTCIPHEETWLTKGQEVRQVEELGLLVLEPSIPAVKSWSEMESLC